MREVEPSVSRRSHEPSLYASRTRVGAPGSALPSRSRRAVARIWSSVGAPVDSAGASSGSEATTCSGARPSRLRWLVLAPRSSRSAQAAAWQRRAAMCSAVSPRSSSASTLAPGARRAASSADTGSGCAAAACSSVRGAPNAPRSSSAGHISHAARPLPATSDGSAPASSRSAATAACERCAAQCSGVAPKRLAALASAPASSSSRATSRLPQRLAMCSADWLITLDASGEAFASSSARTRRASFSLAALSSAFTTAGLLASVVAIPGRRYCRLAPTSHF